MREWFKAATYVAAFWERLDQAVDAVAATPGHPDLAWLNVDHVKTASATAEGLESVLMVGPLLPAAHVNTLLVRAPAPQPGGPA